MTDTPRRSLAEWIKEIFTSATPAAPTEPSKSGSPRPDTPDLSPVGREQIKEVRPERLQKAGYPTAHAQFLAHERATAIQWARGLVRGGDFLILDTETTGLDGRAEVCQIGILAADGTVVFDGLVRPTVPIPADATAIHSITNAMVASAPTFGQLYQRIGDLLGGKHVVIYNASYDRRILAQSARAHHRRQLSARWDDAMTQYARYYGEWNTRKRSFRWQKLPPIPGVAAHNALADCRATLRLIQTMAEARR